MIKKSKSLKKVAVIGGGGHVGLGMCLVLTDAGHEVWCIDKNEESLKKISKGIMPFKEEGGSKILKEALKHNRLNISTDIKSIRSTDVIIVVVGTPIDEHHNPEMENFLSVIKEIKKYLSEGQLIVLRSTVYPNTTNIVKNSLEESGFKVGKNIYLVFAPERVAQHKAIEEMIMLPQLVGSFEDNSYKIAESFFKTYLKNKCIKLKPTEAELGKLFTNMWRYIQFAVANEFYLITESFNKNKNLNVNKIIDKTAFDYPRFQPPNPGANVGGPCLTKDGWFLKDNIPYDEMISSAFNLNEGIANSIINRMENNSPNPKKITLLGMTFKTDSDDIRDSVAFKFKKRLNLRYPNSTIVEVEPNIKGYDKKEKIKHSDWVILITPHSDFSELSNIDNIVDNQKCLYCDIWGYWKEMKYTSNNGFFYSKEVKK